MPFNEKTEKWLRAVGTLKDRGHKGDWNGWNRELICKICGLHMLWLTEKDGRLMVNDPTHPSDNEWAVHYIIGAGGHDHPFEYSVLENSSE